MFQCLPAYVFTCLPFYAFACLLVCQSMCWAAFCLPAFIFGSHACLPAILTMCLAACLFGCLPACHLDYVFGCLPVWLFACLPTCLVPYTCLCVWLPAYILLSLLFYFLLMYIYIPNYLCSVGLPAYLDTCLASLFDDGDVSCLPLSGISGLSFGSPFTSPLLFFLLSPLAISAWSFSC